jgi:hypothetical protein
MADGESSSDEHQLPLWGFQDSQKRVPEILSYIKRVHGEEIDGLPELVKCLVRACKLHQDFAAIVEAALKHMSSESLQALLQADGQVIDEKTAEQQTFVDNLAICTTTAADVEDQYSAYLEEHFPNNLRDAMLCGDVKRFYIVLHRPKPTKDGVEEDPADATMNAIFLMTARLELLRTTDGRAFLASFGDLEAADALVQDDESDMVTIDPSAHAARDARVILRAFGHLLAPLEAPEAPEASEDH